MKGVWIEFIYNYHYEMVLNAHKVFYKPTDHI